MSHRNPLEALEPRTLLSHGLPNHPPTEPGVWVVGRTMHVVGTNAADTLRITRVPGTTQPRNIQVQMNLVQPSLFPGRIERYVLNGGAGNDVIIIDTGLPSSFHPKVCIIVGGAGNDSITASDRADRVYAGDGDDTVNAGNGNDFIDGGAGNDNLIGGAGHDYIRGGDGNDILTGNVGGDRMFGGIGNDSFRNNETAAEREAGGGVRDLLDGGGGNDTAEADPADKRRLITG